MLEIAGIPGRQYHVLDVRHGPMVTMDCRTLVLVHRARSGDATVTRLIEEIVARGATVVTYSDCEMDPIAGVSLEVSSGFTMDTPAQGLPFIFLAQSLASSKADALGIDPDHPEGISAWVNLE